MQSQNSGGTSRNFKATIGYIASEFEASLGYMRLSSYEYLLVSSCPHMVAYCVNHMGNPLPQRTPAGLGVHTSGEDGEESFVWSLGEDGSARKTEAVTWEAHESLEHNSPRFHHSAAEFSMIRFGKVTVTR